jgi:hypothetical protein
MYLVQISTISNFITGPSLKYNKKFKFYFTASLFAWINYLKIKLEFPDPEIGIFTTITMSDQKS